MKKETTDYLLGKIKPGDIKEAFMKKTSRKTIAPIVPYCPRGQVMWEISDKKLEEFIQEIKQGIKNGKVGTLSNY